MSAYTIRHPQLGTRILVYDNEMMAQAINRFNTTILGYDPAVVGNATDQHFDPEPHSIELYTPSQIREMRDAGVSMLRDPHSMQLISFDDYIALYEPAGT